MELLAQLAIIIVATKLAGSIAVKFGQPSVLGEIIIGIIIGPAVLGIIHSNELLKTFSELGVIFLMFFAGVETNIKDLTKNIKPALSVAFMGVILPFIGGYIVGIQFGMNNTHAIFLGIVLTATSVSISVQTFRELNFMHTRESATVLGAAIADDIIGLIILAIMLSITLGGDISITAILVKQTIFFAVILLTNWLVLPKLIKWMDKPKLPDLLIVLSIVTCLTYSYFAEYMGISNIIGAFFAGLAFTSPKTSIILEEKVLPTISVLFIPVFFVSIGLEVSFVGFFDHIWLIIILSVVAVITKIIGASLGARFTGFAGISTLIIGIAMVSRGEVALITSKIGLQNGLFTEEYFTPIIIAIVVTTLVTPPLLKGFISQSKKMAQR